MGFYPFSAQTPPSVQRCMSVSFTVFSINGRRCLFMLGQKYEWKGFMDTGGGDGGLRVIPSDVRRETSVCSDHEMEKPLSPSRGETAGPAASTSGWRGQHGDPELNTNQQLGRTPPKHGRSFRVGTMRLMWKCPKPAFCLKTTRWRQLWVQRLPDR